MCSLLKLELNLLLALCFSFPWLLASPDGEGDWHLSGCFVQQKKLIRIAELLLLHSGCCLYTCSQPISL